MRKLFTDTEAYFEENGPNGNFLPALIIFFVITVGLVTQIYQVRWMYSDVDVPAGVIYVMSGLFTVAITVLVWVLTTACFQGIATIVYERDGSFKTLLRRTAFGMIPYAIGSIIAFCVTVYLTGIIPSPTTEQELQQATATLNNHPWYTVANYLFLVLLVWSGDFWAAAVQTTHDISETRAIKIVALPVLLLIGVFWLFIISS